MNIYHEQQQYSKYLPIRIIFHKNDPDFYVIPHWHEGLELLYVVKGTPGKVLIQGKEYSLKEGDILLIGSKLVHSMELNITPFDKLLTIIIPPEWLLNQNINRDLLNFQPIFKHLEYLQRNQIFKDCLINMILFYEKESLSRVEKLNALINCHVIGAHVISLIRDSDVINHISEENQVPAFLNEAIPYISDNFDKQLDIKKISSEYHVSPEYFSRSFKAVTGLAPKNFILRLRLTKATELLRTTNEDISEIAMECGFGSTKNFFVLFKKYYNTTPLKYRNSSFN